MSEEENQCAPHCQPYLKWSCESGPHRHQEAPSAFRNYPKWAQHQNVWKDKQYLAATNFKKEEEFVCGFSISSLKYTSPPFVYFVQHSDKLLLTE